MQIKFQNEYDYNYDIECDLKHVNLLRLPRKQILSVGVMMLLIAIYSLVFYQIDSNSIVLALFGLALCICGLVPSVIPNTTYRESRGLNSGEAVAATVRFDDAIVYQLAYETAVYQYRDIKAIATSEFLYILVTNDNHWIVVKKGAFSIGDEHEFMTFLKHHCPQLSDAFKARM